MITVRDEFGGWVRATCLVVALVIATGIGAIVMARPAQADVTFDQKMLDLINQARSTASVAPVQLSPALSTIAGPGPYSGCGSPIAGRATDMGVRNYFSHTILNCGSQSVFNVLSSSGLVYSAAAENIGWMNGTTDPLVAAQNLMSGLMASSGHRANILDPRFTHVGIGSWRSVPGQAWTGAGSPLVNVWIAAQVFTQMPVAASATASVSPTSVGFGQRTVGTSGAAQNITLTNTGGAGLSITGTSIGGANAADFSVVSNTCGTGLAAAGSCVVGVAFVPTASGPRSATLAFADNATNSPQTVPLSGTGLAPPLPAAPTNVVAVGGDGQLKVTWSPATSGPATVGYGVFLYDSNGLTGVSTWVCATCTSATFTGLGNGKQMYVAVYSHNGTTWGAGAISNWA